ncbi:hypothetical protein [Corynebacterium sp. UBA2622]|uniref:hypothetical protein n=1 Tax=Corynebacterium sp. UBA2622 TaxID=1946393 RepID=UPI0025C0725C|nr:hypothetical protein [Corynebacterium sp. UBA2622]
MTPSTRPARAPRMFAAAAVAVFSCGLGACGAGDEDSSGGLSTAAGAPGATSAAHGGGAGAAGQGGATAAQDGKQTGDAAPGGGSDAAAPSLANPLGNPNSGSTFRPLDKGNPASAADREEMQRTVYDSMNPGSYDKWTRVLLENSCHKVADSVQAEMDRMGMNIDQVEQAARLQQSGQGIEMPRTEVSLDDVRVDGNRASASVTATSTNGTKTQTEIFEREDGRWKLCN